MLGADHYQEAERLQAKANETTQVHYSDIVATESRWTPHQRAALLADAQVHATLALAAAVIEPTVQALARGEGTDERIITAWSEAVSG